MTTNNDDQARPKPFEKEWMKKVRAVEKARQRYIIASQDAIRFLHDKETEIAAILDAGVRKK